MINLERKGKCLKCLHGECKICGGCHNFDCDDLRRPMKECFDQLLPAKVSEEEKCTCDGAGTCNVCCLGTNKVEMIENMQFKYDKQMPDRITISAPPQEKDWVEKLKPEINIWNSQGRTNDMRWAVVNFLTGQGKIGLDRILASEREKALENHRCENSLCGCGEQFAYHTCTHPETIRHAEREKVREEISRKIKPCKEELDSIFTEHKKSLSKSELYVQKIIEQIFEFFNLVLENLHTKE